MSYNYEIQAHNHYVTFTFFTIMICIKFSEAPLVKPKLRPVDLRSNEVFFDVNKTATGKWISGNWSACSTTCGVGAKIRTVVCSAGNETNCAHSVKPAPAQICEDKPCTKWVYGEWSEVIILNGIFVKKSLKQKKIHFFTSSVAFNNVS